MVYATIPVATRLSQLIHATGQATKTSYTNSTNTTGLDNVSGLSFTFTPTRNVRVFASFSGMAEHSAAGNGVIVGISIKGTNEVQVTHIAQANGTLGHAVIPCAVMPDKVYAAGEEIIVQVQLGALFSATAKLAGNTTNLQNNLNVIAFETEEAATD